jgi:hypothetical protein
VFADYDKNGQWDTLWQWTPEDTAVPTEWTQYTWMIDTTATEPSPGWTLASVEPGGTDSWAEMWKNVFYWNFWTTGGSGMIQNGIDTVVVLAGQPGLPGDFNLDGAVDTADYTIWADNYTGSSGTGGTFSTGDANCDGAVDTADYTIWADYYVGSSAAAVPEPSTLVHLSFLAVIWLVSVRSERNMRRLSANAKCGLSGKPWMAARHRRTSYPNRI